MRGMIVFVTVLATLTACGETAPAPTEAPAVDAAATAPAEGTAAAPAEGTAAPADAAAAPAATGATKEALVKAKGELLPLMAWTDAEAKLAALGAPTKSTADMKSWSVKTGDKCDVLNVTNSGGVVGNVEMQEGVACP